MEGAGCRGGCLEVKSGPGTVLAELAQMSYKGEGGKSLGGVPSALDSWWALHYLQSVGQQLGEASHFWELCRREGQLLECRAISSVWVGLLPQCVLIPQCWAHPDITEMRLASLD